MFDIDGTLAPIVDHASDAHVPESTRQLLIAVARSYGLVACVTGRRASEARAMVSIGSINYLGSHGVELLRAGWTEAVLDAGVADWVRRIHDFGRENDTADTRKRRVRLEDKGPIVAFHWRGAPDEDAAKAAVDAIAQRAAGRRPAHPLGAQGARGPAPGQDRQGVRDHPPAQRGRPRHRERAVRRRRHDRYRRLPRARLAGR